MHRIFLIEDSVDIVDFFKNILPKDIELIVANSVAEAEKQLALNHTFDLIFIDLGLPDGSGYSICSKLSTNQFFSRTPIFIVTGDQSEDSQVLGFKLNIDSYLTKPLKSKVLKSLIENRLHKKSQEKRQNIVTDHFQLDLFSNQLNTNNQSYELTPIESRLLQIFIKKDGQILSREQLIDLVWGNDTSITDRIVDQYISTLRKKLKPTNTKLIKTVYGMGYQAKFKQVA